MPATARNCWKWLLFTLLPFAAGCYSDPGPPQVMLFKATPFPGAASQQVDLDQVQKVVSLRLRAARLARRVQVEPNGLNGLKVSVYGADEAALEQIQSYVT